MFLFLNLNSNPVARFFTWLSLGPRVYLPNGQQLPDSWLNDCVSRNTSPAVRGAMALQAAPRPLAPDLRQCEPWHGVAVAPQPAPETASRPQSDGIRERVTAPTSPALPVRSLLPRVTKTGA